MTTYDRQTYKDKVMKPKAIPRILVRIDRGEDWVEISGDWQPDLPVGDLGGYPVCGEGNTEDWLDYELLVHAWNKLNESVME